MDGLLILGMPGGVEWVIVLVVALLLFGRRLPEIMRGIGGSMREFRKGIEDGPAEKPVVPPKVEQSQAPSAPAADATAQPSEAAKDDAAS
ncbi:MAG: Sec-independent protein translocase subunit TatA/TatB [Planctomycetota bacterium]